MSLPGFRTKLKLIRYLCKGKIAIAIQLQWSFRMPMRYLVTSYDILGQNLHLSRVLMIIRHFVINSRTSVARKLMARLPRLFRTRS